MFMIFTFEKLMCTFFIFLYIPHLTSSFRWKLSDSVYMAWCLSLPWAWLRAGCWCPPRCWACLEPGSMLGAGVPLGAGLALSRLHAGVWPSTLDCWAVTAWRCSVYIQQSPTNDTVFFPGFGEYRSVAGSIPAYVVFCRWGRLEVRIFWRGITGLNSKSTLHWGIWVSLPGVVRFALNWTINFLQGFTSGGCRHGLMCLWVRALMHGFPAGARGLRFCWPGVFSPLPACWSCLPCELWVVLPALLVGL